MGKSKPVTAPRWSDKLSKHVESPKINDFLAEVSEVCKKHGFCIEHEDDHVGFIIQRYCDDKDFEWLNEASIGKTVEDA